MDFAKVLSLVAGYLREEGVRHALIGGHGLAAYGLVRATLDLDLAVEAGAQPGLVDFMEARGYETLHRSEGYSNHLHPDPELGRVDFVYVRGETARKLFAGSALAVGPGGVEIAVPKAEHLIAMKVQAMKNDPERSFQELADIRSLLALPGVDREEVRGYFRKHGLERRFDDLA